MYHRFFMQPEWLWARSSQGSVGMLWIYSSGLVYAMQQTQGNQDVMLGMLVLAGTLISFPLFIRIFIVPMSFSSNVEKGIWRSRLWTWQKKLFSTRRQWFNNLLAHCICTTIKHPIYNIPTRIHSRQLSYQIPYLLEIGWIRAPEKAQTPQRPQSVRIGRNIFSTLTLNASAPQHYMLSP